MDFLWIKPTHLSEVCINPRLKGGLRLESELVNRLILRKLLIFKANSDPVFELLPGNMVFVLTVDLAVERLEFKLFRVGKLVGHRGFIISLERK